MDVVILSRIQFALNVSFHYIFPPLSIGLSLLLVIMEGCYLWTKNEVYEKMTKFWVGIFALIFAIGVASGLVLVFAFGNNWANFSRFVGDVFGSILGAEGIFAFFMESGFLGVLLFGWNRVSKKMHLLSTVLVSTGAHFSALWIVMANSWMQTPVGHKMIGEGAAAHATIENFWRVLINHSSIDRLIHVILGCYLAGSFLVISVSAFYLLKHKYEEFAKKSMNIALLLAAFSTIAQLFSGDSSAHTLVRYQPVKLAAFEGVYKEKTPTPMYAFGVVNPKTKTVKGVKLPGMLSLLIHYTFKKAVPSLDQFPEELWPNVPIVFQTYHLMIMMWGLMAVAVLFAAYGFTRKKLQESKWTLRYLVISVIFPQIANQMGWWSTEIGRQPWVVYGHLKTKDAISPLLSSGQVLGSLILFSIIYLFLFALFIFLMDRKIRGGPDAKEPIPYRDLYKVS